MFVGMAQIVCSVGEKDVILLLECGTEAIKIMQNRSCMLCIIFVYFGYYVAVVAVNNGCLSLFNQQYYVHHMLKRN